MTLSNRKIDHIELAKLSQSKSNIISSIDYSYEPLLGCFDKKYNPVEDDSLKTLFLGKTIRFPFWISSITGGHKMAQKINKNMAYACKKFDIGMGLGSIRPLLESKGNFEDFNLRPIIGKDLPFFANLGIAQIHEININNKYSLLIEILKSLEVDGLIIHINPLQEWRQPEGDSFNYSSIYILKCFMDNFNLPVIVKEVGNGIGPDSLKELLKLPIKAIEFGAFGGTNFYKLENLRDESNQSELYSPLINVGETSMNMINNINSMNTNIEFIISGGISNYFEGYLLNESLKASSVYGMAFQVLNRAKESRDILEKYLFNQFVGLKFVKEFIRVKGVK